MWSMDHSFSVPTCSGNLDVLEQCLRDLLALIKPLEVDQRKRMETINKIEASIGLEKSLEGTAVKSFGSFISNLYTKWSDLDISIQFTDSRRNSLSIDRQKSLLKDISKTLKKNGATSYVEYIPSRKVPIIKFVSYNGISCDISVNNHPGLIKSKILFWISEIEERFRDMVLLTKEWAKAQNINDPKSGTLNSYSLCLLVIFHFQTCQPAILPPVREMYEGNIFYDITGSFPENIEDAFAANIRRFQSKSSKERNGSSLSQLLISFFHKFSDIESLAKQHVICTYTGQLESIGSMWEKKSYKLIVEDPLERSENAARAVRVKALSMIAYKFKDAYYKLSSGSVLQNRASLLATLTGRDIGSQHRSRPKVQYNAHPNRVDGQPHLFSGDNTCSAPVLTEQDSLFAASIRPDVTSWLQSRPPEVQKHRYLFSGDDTSKNIQHPSSRHAESRKQRREMRKRNAYINQQVDNQYSESTPVTKRDYRPGSAKDRNGQSQDVANKRVEDQKSESQKDEQHGRAKDRRRQTATRGDPQQLAAPSAAVAPSADPQIAVGKHEHEKAKDHHRRTARRRRPQQLVEPSPDPQIAAKKHEQHAKAKDHHRQTATRRGPQQLAEPSPDPQIAAEKHEQHEKAKDHQELTTPLPDPQIAGEKYEQHERAKDHSRRTAARRTPRELTAPSPGTFTGCSYPGVQRQKLVWKPKLSSG